MPRWIWNGFLLTGVFCLVSASFAQLFEVQKPAEPTKPGINKIPPLIPVMSNSDFQNKVDALSDQNRKAMTSKGLETIEKQLSALPSNHPNEPPPPPSKPTDKDKDIAEKPIPEAKPQTTEAETDTNNDQENTETTENDSGSTSSAEDNNAPSITNPPNPGQLNIQY